MKILIISGFLGAGKTSFIKAMVHATGRQFVIVENEFGNLNLDSKILRDDANNNNNQDMKIWELTEGCICCSMNMDFSLSVMTIANTLNPDYLLVEPSGVALPGRIMESLKKISYENIRLLQPVTIIDALHFRQQRQEYGEYFNDQLAAAGTVVLSKSEGLTESEFIEIENELNLTERAEAGAVTFHRSHYSHWTRDMWLELLSKDYEPEANNANANSEPAAPSKPLESISLQGVEFASPVELIAKLEMLCFYAGVFGRIIRAKGCAPKIFGDEWLEFNVVDGTYEVGSALKSNLDMDRGEMVIIGENINHETLHQFFGGDIIEEDDDEEEDD